jgi:hypothetical protein
MPRGSETRFAPVVKPANVSMHRLSLESFRKHVSQEDVDRGHVNHDIGTCDHMQGKMI